MSEMFLEKAKENKGDRPAVLDDSRNPVLTSGVLLYQLGRHINISKDLLYDGVSSYDSAHSMKA